MAAFSAVASFRQSLEQLQDSDQLPLDFPKPQRLLLKVISLQSSLDKIPFVPKKWRKDMNELQTKIREAIYEAQDLIDLSISKGQSFSFKKVSNTIDLVAEKAAYMAEKIGEDLKKRNLVSENPQPPKSNLGGSDKIVGQEKDSEYVTDWLESEDRKLQIMPITGLPGIGKTTLAKSLYEDQAKKNTNFDIRAWVTVSQEYNVQEIFSKILSSMESKRYPAGHYAFQGDEVTLLGHVRNVLYHLKYLVVIDDIWDLKVWDAMSHALLDRENGSRIILTTRISVVAEYFLQTYGFRLVMQPLSEADSWLLLCYKVFGDKFCPAHLSVTGKGIAKKCKGLPLSLTVVGGLLSQERVKVEYWKMIEEDTSDAAAKGGDETYLEILSLSYNYLPGKLKGCFLYMGAFPEDSEIRVSKLVKLWVAEGFLISPASTTHDEQHDPILELVAKKSLEDLRGRYLISIGKKNSNGGMKVCGMHDSLRDLAEKASRTEKFFHSRKKLKQELSDDTEMQRRVSVRRNILMCIEDVYEKTKTITYARSLLYVGPHHHHPMPYVLTFDLLRVLDAFTVYLIHFPDEFLQLVHLTYLSLTYNGKISAEIAQLRRLQVLMVRRHPKIIFVGASYLPDEIWSMPQLRHIWFTETDFPAFPSQVTENRVVLLLNLQTLANVNAAFFTDEVLDNMPNLTKLSMWMAGPGKIGFSLKKMSKLEFFKFVVMNPIPGKGIEVEAEDLFPITLRRVNLSGCGLPWEYMRFLAEKLRGLQVLKLRELAFHGEEWRLEYVFKNLKYLLIEYLNFQKWEVEDKHFPILERLILRHCYELDEIPEGIKYIGHLELIELVDCSPKAVKSANKIMGTQEDEGLDNFQVRIFSSWEYSNPQ